MTELTQTAPNELSFTRQAPGGLTAIELTALANWLEATNFRAAICVCRRRNPESSARGVPGAP